MTPDQVRSRLSAYLARRSPEQSVRSLGPLAVLAGGWESSLYTFARQEGESGDARATTSVLKMYAPNARGREHATREWRALIHLHVMKYPVPRVIFFEPDVRHLGRPFIVMEYIPGASFWDVFEAADSAAQDQLARLFATQLARLHALDPRLLESAAVPTHPYSYIEQELELLRRDSTSSPHAILTQIVQWLDTRQQAVPCERPAILHRDYHPWNVLVDAVEHLWVIDWDWQIGDARFDLAWTCTLMRRSNFYAFSSVVRDEYAQQSDRSLDDLTYFEVLTTVRWLLNVLPSTRADFREFLVEPVRQAQTFLHENTGIDVNIRM